MTKENVATRLLLDMTEAIQARDRERFRELFSQKVAIKNVIMVEEYMKDRYIALLEGAFRFSFLSLANFFSVGWHLKNHAPIPCAHQGGLRT